MKVFTIYIPNPKGRSNWTPTSAWNWYWLSQCHYNNMIYKLRIAIISLYITIFFHKPCSYANFNLERSFQLWTYIFVFSAILIFLTLNLSTATYGCKNANFRSYLTSILWVIYERFEVTKLISRAGHFRVILSQYSWLKFPVDFLSNLRVLIGAFTSMRNCKGKWPTSYCLSLVNYDNHLTSRDRRPSLKYQNWIFAIWFLGAPQNVVGSYMTTRAA